MQNRTAEDIRRGKVMSSQCMFDAALQNERDEGLNFWDDGVPDGRLHQLHRACARRIGQQGDRLERHVSTGPPRASTSASNIRPGWQQFERRGGMLEIKDAGIADLETYAAASDLTIVAAGKGDIARLFERDAEKSPFDKPQRALALTYVHGMTPRPDHSAVNFNLIPGSRRVFRLSRR